MINLKLMSLNVTLDPPKAVISKFDPNLISFKHLFFQDCDALLSMH